MLFGEADHALEGTQAVDAALGEERFGPGAGVRTNQPAALEPILGAALHAAAFVGVDVRIGRGKAARFRPGVQRDHLLAMIEDTHDPGLAADPHLAAEMLRWHRVVSLVELDVTVPVHLAPGLGEAGEERRGQRQEGRPLALEHRAHLLAHRAVDPGAGDAPLPIGEEEVLLGERGERASAQRVVLGVFYARLDLALVFRSRGLGRHDDGVVVPGEVRHLGVKVRIEPVRVEDRGLQVVDDGGAGDATEVPERVLAASDERLGVLTPDDLAVALAGVAEHGAKQMRPAPLAVRLDPRALAEVDLHLLAGRTLEAAERQRERGARPAHEAFDRLVAASEAVLGAEILMDPLRGEAALQRCRDQLPVRLAPARRPRRKPGGRVAGGFCRRRVTLHRLTVHRQLAGNPPLRPAPLRQCNDRLL